MLVTPNSSGAVQHNKVSSSEFPIWFAMLLSCPDFFLRETNGSDHHHFYRNGDDMVLF